MGPGRDADETESAIAVSSELSLALTRVKKDLRLLDGVGALIPNPAQKR